MSMMKEAASEFLALYRFPKEAESFSAGVQKNYKLT
jgi:hypothetical protein